VAVAEVMSSEPSLTWLSLCCFFFFFQLTTQQITTQGPQQKVAYAAQPALKTQFLTTPISQAQKLAGTQQVQTQIQVSMRQGGG
jgi:hypothetical protein